MAQYDLLGRGQLLVTVILGDPAARVGRWGTLMRHFLVGGSSSLPVAVPLLTGGVLEAALKRLLVAPPRLPLLLEPTSP